MDEDLVDVEKVFSEGTDVEVTSFEEGFRGAWFTATILKTPNNKTKGKTVSVRYNNLVADDNETPLTERVKLSFVRPSPPQTRTPADHCFEVGDVVDAFHLDGWWVGSVSQVLDVQNKYVVSFAEPPEEIEFSPSDLRPHWEWVGGKWVKSSKFQEYLVSYSKEPLELSCNNLKDAGAIVLHESSAAVESGLKSFKHCYAISRRTKVLLSASEGPGRSKDVKRATPESDATPLHPSKKFKDGSSANSLLPESHMKDTDQPKVEYRVEKNVGVLKECGRKLKFDAEDLRYPAADKMDNKVAAIEIYEAEKMTKEVESSVPKRLPKGCMNGSEPEESWHLTKEEINLEKEHGMNRHQKENGAKSCIKRTEQPCVVFEIKQPKVVFQISQSPFSGKDDAVGVVKETVSEEYTATEVNPSAMTRSEQAGHQTMSIERNGVGFATDCQRKITKEAGKSGGILHENDEQSPSICDKKQQSGSQKLHSVLGEEYSDVPPGFKNIWHDPREKSPQIMVQSPAVGKTGDNVQVEDQEIPFVKSLPIWKEVELMEIFQVMPQNPHFKPLTELNEIPREAVAVGHMLTFVSVVQRTSKLTVADPKNLFTSIIDALLDLEKLGFDVKAVRNRASDLMFMKDRHKHLQDQTKEVEVQVTQKTDELTKINEEIDANLKLLKELQEKQALLLSMQKSKISEIASLQASADDTNGDMHNIVYDFESLAARPW